MKTRKPDWQTADGAIQLYCGDCLEILPMLGKVDAVITDPPYGIGYSSGMGGKFKDVTIHSDDSLDARDAVLAHFTGLPALVFGSWKMPKPSGTRHTIIWEKGDHVGMGDLSLPWRPNTEEIYVIGNGFSGHRGSSVLRVNAPSPNFTPNAARYHPTEKPVALMAELIAKCKAKKILDPFMGSGTTGVAAVQMGRQFIGIEREPKYFKIAVKRIEAELNAYPLIEPKREIKRQELFA